ncbi:hypothetical protein ACI8AF_15350 [Blastococcus sp. SYSU D00669]
MRRRWTLRFLAGLALSALLVSGCSSKQEANDTLPSAEETTSSPALEPLGPPDFPVPDEARTQDAAGAEAALRYYLQLVAHQQAKAGQPLRDLSRDCGLCTFLADRADRDAASGYTVEGGDPTIVSISPPAVNGSSAEFSFSIAQSAVLVRDSAGALVPERQAPDIPVLVGAAAMEWDQSRHAWITRQLSFTQQ